MLKPRFSAAQFAGEVGTNGFGGGFAFWQFLKHGNDLRFKNRLQVGIRFEEWRI